MSGAARRLALFGMGLLLVAIATPAARADVYLGWADEFWLGTVAEYSNGGCSSNVQLVTYNNWFSTEPSFSLLGTQTLAGKANTRAKAMFRFDVKNGASCYESSSVTIQRFYWSPTQLPSQGSSCAGGTPVAGTAVQTFDSLSAGANNIRINNRLLPVFDFSAQTGTGVYAYRDNLSFTAIMGTALNQNACYEISWQ